jgi:hypothetical protein
MEEFVNAFLDWFRNDNHSIFEDFYTNQITSEQLKQLSKDEFIEFINQFAREGGKIQSGGYRTAPQLIENVNKNYEEFRGKIMEPLTPGFNLDSWLQWCESFPFFGKGLATIYLNRVNKQKYVIVNNKSVDGLKKLGYKIPSANLKSQYDAILAAEKKLLEKYPAIENFFRVDAMMHYIIGTDEGGKKFDELVARSYFNLKGFKDYTSFFGSKYDGNSPAVSWFYDTRNKLEYLVTLLSDKLKRNYTINYKERPNTQGGNLKNYVLTGFSPDGVHPDGKLFIKLAFHTLNNNPAFDVEIDVDEKIIDNQFRPDKERRRDNTRLRIPVDQNFPQDWTTLISSIYNHVETLTHEYKKITGTPTPVNPIVPKTSKIMSLNNILYGPPGTGKTYQSISYAVSIVENKPVEEIALKERSSIKNRFEKYIEEGQIVFCTFHQSLGYEDFIEGIKPVEPASDDEQLSYEVVDGIFKRMCTNASFSFVQQDITKETENALDFSSAYDEFVDDISEQILKGEGIKIPTISGGIVMAFSITRNNNIKIKHINGTREYTVSKNRLAKLALAFPDLDQLTNINDQFRAEIGGSNSSAYWAVLNAIKQRSNQKINKTEVRIVSDKEYSYDDKKRIIETLKDDDFKKVNTRKFVLIIDEINRGNVSQVFGEIITLMEDDKRLGSSEALKAILPYSKDNFGIPGNLYIIGTMNTADRSVEALDTALRRRFSFINLESEPDKLLTTEDGIDLAEMLNTLNNRLSILKDSDHTIGHAWLWNVRNIDQLKEVFKVKILPLLKEFFYNDYEKLGLVLGDAFFETNMQINSNVFANFSGGNGLAMQYDKSWQFRLKPGEKLTISDFKTLTPQNNRSIPDEKQ